MKFRRLQVFCTKWHSSISTTVMGICCSGGRVRSRELRKQRLSKRPRRRWRSRPTAIAKLTFSFVWSISRRPMSFCFFINVFWHFCFRISNPPSLAAATIFSLQGTSPCLRLQPPSAAWSFARPHTSRILAISLSAVSNSLVCFSQPETRVHVPSRDLTCRVGSHTPSLFPLALLSNLAPLLWWTAGSRSYKARNSIVNSFHLAYSAALCSRCRVSKSFNGFLQWRWVLFTLRSLFLSCPPRKWLTV